MKENGLLIIAAGVIFYLGVDRIVKAVEGLISPKKEEPKPITEGQT